MKTRRERFLEFVLKQPAILVLLLLALPFAAYSVAVLGYQDLQIATAPGNPPSGFLRFFGVTGGLGCLTSAGADCLSVATINGAAVPASAAVTGTDGTRRIIAATAAALSAINYAAGGGTANAQSAAYAPAIGAMTLNAGLGPLCWLPTTANTSSTPTFVPNSLTPATIVKRGGAALVANDLTTTAIACAIYDGTAWELQNPQTAAASFANPMTTAGDIIYGGASGVATRLAAGTSGYVLQTNGATAPSWVLPASGTSTTVASGTSTMGTSAITSGACASAVTTTATGVATTDAIIVSVNADPTSTTGYIPSSSGSLYIWAFPTSGNVNFDVCNNTSSSVTPSAITLNWRVVR